MSVFGKIMGAIFGNATAAPGPTTGPGSGQGSTTGNAAPVIPSSSPGAQAGSPAPSGSSAAPTSRPTSGGAASPSVDVASIVDKAAAAKGEKLNWKTSIVDLMKALDIDSSLAARKDLAKELGYPGDTNESAAMNVWLHKQVMTRLAENGGKLPADIKHG